MEPDEIDLTDLNLTFSFKRLFLLINDLKN
jgi:hypothetical protein